MNGRTFLDFNYLLLSFFVFNIVLIRLFKMLEYLYHNKAQVTTHHKLLFVIANTNMTCANYTFTNSLLQNIASFNITLHVRL